MIKFEKNILIRTVIVIVCGVILFLMVYNNYDSYQRSVAKIEDVNGSGSVQNITAVIKNGDSAGQTVHIKNKYDRSLVYDEKYHSGDQVFLNETNDGITGVKRDYLIAGAVLVLFGILVIFGGGQGGLTVICLIMNVLLFSLMMKLYLKGRDILGLSAAACVIFAFLVLLFINGPGRKMLISFSATLASVAIVGLISLILIWSTKDMGYEFLDFLPEPYTTAEADHFFLAQILIGCIGAVMDVAVTITACSTEIINRTPGMTVKPLMVSVREVADDITGPMINVIFFTNVAAVIPIFMISMNNDIRFTTVIRYDAFFELARFLTGAAAVFIAIPMSVFAASLFLKGGRSK
ncbi:MAG: YibE/F family protein [Eubacteriaceae bacterium]|nr:YibE/F family protein [Eubacteriaceae bacterium]